MRARIISLALAFVMIFGSFVSTTAAATITDVKETKYESAVKSLEALGIIDGYEDNTYRPEREISRAEIAKLFVVAMGLDTAADLYKGTTKFSDVAENHWATGYINIASQYGIVNGYPDGTFAPDAPVKYSEAVTMAVRVLGYKNMVDSKGTWPINYISKAQELKILKDINYNNYSDNAIRGDVALLIWNILNVPTWGIVGESEGNGLTYGYCESLLDQHFENYIYVEDIVVVDVKVEKGKVYIYFVYEDELTGVELEQDIAFLDLVGRKVTFLYNNEINKVVELTTDTEDEVVEDYRNELIEDEYDFDNVAISKIWGTEESGDTDYTVAIVGNKKVVEYETRYCLGQSYIVREKELKNEKLKINKNELTIPEEAIILIDGEWKTVKDIKVNDIITVLETNELYIISREVVVGEFETVVKENDDIEKYYITLDGNNYSVLNGIKEVVELDEDNKEVYTTSLEDILADDESKYLGEEATIYVNFLNEIVKITFEEIVEEKDMGNFYVLTYPQVAWEEKDKKDIITYVDLNGKTYEVAEDVVLPTENLSGDVVYATINDKGVVTELYNVLTSGDSFSGDYLIKVVEDDKAILDNDNYISGDYKVTKSTVVVKITAVEKDEKVKEYNVEIVRDAAYLEGIKYAVVAIETEDVFERAAYVFVWEDAKNTDKEYGIVDKYTREPGKDYLTIDGKRYEVEEIEIDLTVDAEAKGRLVEFISNDTIKITKSYGSGDIENAIEVTAVDGSLYEISGDKVYDLDTKELEDKRILVAEVEENDNAYRFTSLEEIDVEDIRLEKGDKLIEDVDMFLIIKGYDK